MTQEQFDLQNAPMRIAYHDKLAQKATREHRHDDAKKHRAIVRAHQALLAEELKSLPSEKKAYIHKSFVPTLLCNECGELEKELTWEKGGFEVSAKKAEYQDECEACGAKFNGSFWE